MAKAKSIGGDGLPAKTVPVMAPAPAVSDDTLLAYAMVFGRDFVLLEKSAPGFKAKQDRFRQKLTVDAAHFIARRWISKTLMVKTVLVSYGLYRDTNYERRMAWGLKATGPEGVWTITDTESGDVIEFSSRTLEEVKSKVTDTQGAGRWKPTLSPPVASAREHMEHVAAARGAAEGKRRREVRAYPPKPGTAAERALEAAEGCRSIRQAKPEGKAIHWEWGQWKDLTFKTFEKYLKDPAFYVFAYSEKPHWQWTNLHEPTGAYVGHASFCSISDPECREVFAFSFIGNKPA